MKESSNKIASIIVVTKGKNNHLRACLDSLNRQTYRYQEVIVIDNSQNPDFSKDIRRNYP